MAWMLHFMALRPDVQARMRAEVDAELGDADRPRARARAALRYLGAVAQETLRLEVRGADPVHGSLRGHGGRPAAARAAGRG